MFSQLAIFALAASADAPSQEPTWSRDVAPILHANCVECHRPDQAAPFPLLAFEDAAKRARTIARVVTRGSMPPWHPVEGHGEFRDARGLSEAERDLLATWAAAGAPEGDPALAPAPPEFAAGWTLGEPDLVVRSPEPFTIPADGPDLYRNFVLPLGTEADRWVRAIEVRPSARTVVHHVLFFHDTSGEARAADEADPLPGFSGMRVRGTGALGGWAVGAGPYELPEGLAMELPAGADLLLQTHFHPSGKEEAEATEVGLWFAEAAPERPLVGILLPPDYAAHAGLDVPAGDGDWRLSDEFELPVDAELWTVGAHMHYIGREARAWATLPDGSEQRLFYIDDWDFNWQGRYEYAAPVVLPAGSVVHVELRYDNSAENPRNPAHPPRRVTWGLESTDEMGAVSFVATAREPEGTDALRASVREHGRKARRNRVRVQVDWYSRVMRLDRDGDGRLSAEEIPAAYRGGLARLDRNDDGELDADELAVLRRPIEPDGERDGGRDGERDGGRDEER